tara:strand:- start:225 stop:626 length:402 start_codon:yes stop_codon:yes gene_type:complete
MGYKYIVFITNILNLKNIGAHMSIPYSIERQLTKEHGKLITMYIERIVKDEIESEVLYFLAQNFHDLEEIFIEEEAIQVWIISNGFANFLFNNYQTLEVLIYTDKSLWIRRTQGNLWTDSHVIEYAQHKASQL